MREPSASAAEESDTFAENVNCQVPGARNAGQTRTIQMLAAAGRETSRGARRTAVAALGHKSPLQHNRSLNPPACHQREPRPGPGSRSRYDANVYTTPKDVHRSKRTHHCGRTPSWSIVTRKIVCVNVWTVYTTQRSTGEIMIMAYTLFPPLMITAGQRIAQLIPLDQSTRGLPPKQEKERGTAGFGSTGGLTLLTINLNDRPKRKTEIEYQGQKRAFMGLLDTGADSSIIAPDSWPQHWPLQPAATTVTGVGGMTLASRSPPLTVIIDKKRVTATFSVVQLPATVHCLIGRDILSQLGVVLTNDLPLP